MAQLGCLYSDIIDDDGREIIQKWSEKRRSKFKTKSSIYYRHFFMNTLDLSMLTSFIQNFNFMVIIQMVVAAVTVYLSKHYNLKTNIQVIMFVSPIVFPLAFLINTDFQRKEKVLDDLANFKAAGMSWYFCMRDWRLEAQLSIFWINEVHQKLKGMIFYMKEYLLSEKKHRRQIILEAIYEDFSDVNQLIENVRTSKLPLNSALISRCQILLNSLCLAFERLRVVREYRSPRSIRAFNKVLIFFLPIILSPYFAYVGKVKKNEWVPYYISVLVAFVFSALQGVHDKLNDPFDGMTEDDINLSSIDDWTFQSLEATVNREFVIKVADPQTNLNNNELLRKKSSFNHGDPDQAIVSPKIKTGHTPSEPTTSQENFPTQSVIKHRYKTNSFKISRKNRSSAIKKLLRTQSLITTTKRQVLTRLHTSMCFS